MERTAPPVHDCGARDDRTAADTETAFPSRTQLQLKQNPHTEGRDEVCVVLRQPTWLPKLEVVVPVTSFLCAVALFLCVDSALWLCVLHHGRFYISSWNSEVYHEHTPLFSERNEGAGYNYTAATESSVNRSHDPCDSVHRHVYDGWKHQHRLPSVADSAEDSMCERREVFPIIQHRGRNVAGMGRQGGVSFKVWQGELR